MKILKDLKIILLFILIFMFIYLNSSTVYASMANNARHEGGHSPVVYTPDTPSNPVSNPSSTDEYQDIVIEIPHYTYIEGNVFEDLGYDSETMHLTKTRIPGVKVSAIDSSGTVIAETLSDEQGRYRLEPPPGEYDLKFVYGDVNNLNHSSQVASSLNISNILYYNGHDYVVSKIPTGEYDGGCETISTEIIQGGKTVSQVMLLIDASWSMRHTDIVVDGVTMTRFENALNATKKLISDLLEDSDTIYIGIVVFAGNNWRAASLSKDQDFLYDVIEDLKVKGDEYFEEYTNIKGAFDKAMKSFYIDENDPDYRDHSNRNIVLISDGIPTSDGTTKVYNDDSDDAILNKLYNTIRPSTRNIVKEAVDDGINVMTLITRSDDSDERDYVDSIYRDLVTEYMEVSNESELAVAIRNSIAEFINRMGSTSSFERDKIIIKGFEDSTRRAVVDSHFNETPFYFDVTTNDVEPDRLDAVQKTFQGSSYNAGIASGNSLSARTSLFRAVTNTTRELTEKVKTLSDGTYMTATAEGYKIDAPQESRTEETITETDSNGVTHTYKKITIHYNTGYTSQNLELARRQDFTLRVVTTATAYRCILNTGEVLTEEHRVMGTDSPILEWLDETLAHGATLQIEYTVEVYNDSSVPCNYLELINYLPRGFVFDMDSDMLTEGMKNSETGWLNLDLNEAKRTGLTSFDAQDVQNNCIRLIKSESDDFLIKPGGREPFTTKFMVSRVIGGLDDVKDTINDDGVEILAYKNLSDRRMIYNNNEGTTPVTKKVGVYPGDTRNAKSGSGVDCALSTNIAIVSPPTGSKILVIKVSSITILLTLILYGYIRIKNNKNK